jgi:hypothetical protein
VNLAVFVPPFNIATALIRGCVSLSTYNASLSVPGRMYGSGALAARDPSLRGSLSSGRPTGG